MTLKNVGVNEHGLDLLSLLQTKQINYSVNCALILQILSCLKKHDSDQSSQQDFSKDVSVTKGDDSPTSPTVDSSSPQFSRQESRKRKRSRSLDQYITTEKSDSVPVSRPNRFKLICS